MPAPPTAVVAVLALLGGAAAGVGLERTGVLSPLAEPEAAVVRADRVAVLDCPEGSVLTALGRGDRVLATGRSADDEWVEIRSPLDLDARAWLPVGVVSGDEGEGDLADLPVRECEERGGPTTSTSSTTTSSTSTSTSTTLLEETTTTELPPEEPTVPPPTRPQPATTTTTRRDTRPPVLGTISLSEDAIFDSEQAQLGKCDGVPTTSLIEVTATDDRPGVTVQISHERPGVAAQPLAVTPAGANSFSATLGPFPSTAVPDGGGPVNITVRITAVDAAGNATAAAPRTVVLLDCADPN